MLRCVDGTTACSDVSAHPARLTGHTRPIELQVICHYELSLSLLILRNGCVLLVVGDPTGVLQGCGAAYTAAANISRAFTHQMHFIRFGGYTCALPTFSLGCAITHGLVNRVTRLCAPDWSVFVCLHGAFLPSCACWAG